MRRRPPKFWVQNIFNFNLQQNLRFLQHSSRYYLPCQKQPAEVFCKNGVLRHFTKFTGKHLCHSLFFNKVLGLRLATLFKKRLWHRCFPVNFVKFLKTTFYIEHPWWLLFPRLSLYIFFAALLYNPGNCFRKLSSAFLLRDILCINLFRFLSY